MASASGVTATTTNEQKTTDLTANFAQSKKSPTAGNQLSIGYDHETYLQLTAGANAEIKTPNQIYMEERTRRLHLRAQDPAVSDPQSGPSPTDFEYAYKHSKHRPSDSSHQYLFTKQ
ncbi:hypothetical protein DTO195F2_7977 [Paecilomyces variotii]|nr:hypothetical protein DTO195F2_7977 [Paecilomyces variotii]KAJ9374707.1 hypothetical protein DTO282E5_790 [Paecilomyces variotii]